MAWGKIGTKLISWFSKGRLSSSTTKTILNGSGQILRKEVIQNVGKGILTWGNAAKVAVIGGIGYIFLSGGLSNTVSSLLGIPEWAAQLLIWVVAGIVLLYIFKRIVGFLRGFSPFRSTGYRRRY
jgi:hypothetical protein